MVAFPDLETSVYADSPIEESIEFRTLIADFEGGGDSRKQKWLFPKRHYTLKYEWISTAEARILWQFHLARKGCFERFNLFQPFTDEYVGEYVGTGDGITKIFNLPSKLAAAYTFYLSNVAQGSGFTFTSQGGADGADKLEFTVAPALGVYITTDFIGYLKTRHNFADDIMTFRRFYSLLVTTGLKLKGRLNE